MVHFTSQLAIIVSIRTIRTTEIPLYCIFIVFLYHICFNYYSNQLFSSEGFMSEKEMVII